MRISLVARDKKEVRFQVSGIRFPPQADPALPGMKGSYGIGFFVQAP